jgi:hypothetical protein
VGFLAGAIFLRLMDAVLPHLHPFKPMSEAEGLPTTWRRTTLLVLAITLHNLPEGIALGVAFAAAHAAGIDGVGAATFGGAIALTIGLALQNFPEGMAVSMPLRQAGVSRFKSFWYGQLSAVVEPIGAVLGAAAVLLVQPLLPYALAFAAGAMIYVVVEELIPEAQQGGRDRPGHHRHHGGVRAHDGPGRGARLETRAVLRIGTRLNFHSLTRRARRSRSPRSGPSGSSVPFVSSSCERRYGSSTASITWMIPLLASTSVTTICESLMYAPPSFRLMVVKPPFAIRIRSDDTTSAAVRRPGAT